MGGYWTRRKVSGSELEWQRGTRSPRSRIVLQATGPWCRRCQRPCERSGLQTLMRITQTSGATAGSNKPVALRGLTSGCPGQAPSLCPGGQRVLLGGGSKDRVLGAVLPPAGVWGGGSLQCNWQQTSLQSPPGFGQCCHRRCLPQWIPHERRRTGWCRELSCFTPGFKGQDGDTRALLSPCLPGKEVGGFRTDARILGAHSGATRVAL